MNIFLSELRQNIKWLFAWNILTVVVMVFGLSLFNSIEKDAEVLTEIVRTMPLFMTALLGLKEADVSTISGYYGFLHLFISFALSSFAAILGANILAKEQRDGTCEFLYSRPVWREEIVIRKLLSALVMMIEFDATAFLTATITASTFYSTNISSEALKLTLGILFMQLIFLSAGIFISILMKNKTETTGASALIVMLTYGMFVAYNAVDSLHILRYFTPFGFFGAEEILKNGLSIGFICLSLVISILLISLSLVLHGKKDM